jgi:hypothetical protein
MAVALTSEMLETLSMLASMKHDPLCPHCGQRKVDPRSENGWCVRCDARRERQLESKRKWWAANRGAEAGQ